MKRTVKKMPKKITLEHISAKAKSNGKGELSIYGDISDVKWWDEDVTPKDIDEKLKDLNDCTEIDIYINSYGGSVFAGQAIATMLDRCKATKTVHIDGIAASMASVIAMCGDKIIMPDNALMMIHKPSSCACGNADDLRKAADMLDKAEETLVILYMRHFNKSESELKELLAAETWLTADEALGYGLINEKSEAIEMAASAKGLVFNKLEIGKDTNIYKSLTAKGAINNMEIKAKLKELGIDILDTDTLDTVLAKLNDGWDGAVTAIQAKAKTADPEPTPTEPVPAEPTPAPAEPTATPTATHTVSAQADPVIVAKAAAFDKLKASAVDEAIKHGIQAKGENFNEDRWRNIFNAMDFDDIKAQADEWTAEAKTVLHAGGRVSEEPTGTDISDEINPDDFKI
jgi:ATP-dependent Clp protease, protease subunit